MYIFLHSYFQFFLHSYIIINKSPFYFAVLHWVDPIKKDQYKWKTTKIRYIDESQKRLHNQAEKDANNKAEEIRKEFEEEFTYGGELGALWQKEETTFRVWAPLAEKVFVNLYLDLKPHLMYLLLFFLFLYLIRKIMIDYLINY